jgi:hypothetical protein
MSFKSFDLAHDVASIVSAVNEVLSISSSLYAPGVGDQNVKTYQNISSGTVTTPYGGYWETVYDSSPASIQSTALFDVSFGYSADSHFTSTTAPLGLINEKTKVYRELASTLLGDPDATFGSSQSDVWNECFFVLVKRGIAKDELKKGVVNVTLNGINGIFNAIDQGAGSNYKQTVGGDYAPLYKSGTTTDVLGQVWYNAGVIIIPVNPTSQMPWNIAQGDTVAWSGSSPLAQFNIYNMMTGSTINNLVDGFRGHMNNLAFHNQTNLYSTVYFCRATNTEFNYSSNPTFTDATTQRILVTSGSNVLQSRTYITKVGLYDANDNLLAVGSVNKPITKSPDTESVFRIRLDY